MKMNMKMKVTGGLVLLVLLFAMVGCGGAEAKKEKYTARAQRYIEEENWPKARVALRNVLKIDPKDAGATYLSALVEEKEKNWINAFRYYLLAVELDPNHRDALLKLGRFYLEGKLPEKVEETAEKILAVHPNDPGAETLRAAALALQGREKEALAQVEAIHQRHPAEPDAASLLTALYTGRKQLDQAESVLRRALERNPKNVVLLNNLSRTLVRMGRMEQAEAILRRIVEVEPKQFDHRVRLAAFYAHRNDLERAEATLREAVRLDPESEDRRLAFAEFMAARKEPKQGEAILLEAKRDLARSAKIRLALGQFYERNDQREKARAVYEEMIEEEGSRPPGLEAQVKLAALDFAEGKGETAAKRLGEVLQENPTASEAILLQGKMALSLGDGKEAVQSFRTALKDQPERAELHTLLGRAYLLTGDARLARESFEKAVSLDPRQLDARRALVRLDLGAGRAKEARRAIEAILSDQPKDIESLALLSGLQMAAKEWPAAEGTLRKLREAGAGPFVVGMAEGEFHQARKEWDRAVSAFERAAADRPDAPDPLFALIRIDLNRGKADAAEGRLRRLLAERPGHFYANGMMGEVLLLKKDFEGAERAFKEANRIKPDWITPWRDRASLKLVQKKPAEAIAILEEGLSANPKSLDLRLLLASTLNETNQTDRAISHYEAILGDHPRSILAANNLAALLADKKGDAKSLERALALTRDFEKNAPEAPFLDTLGWVHVKRGQAREGVRLLEQAAAKAPDQPIFQYHLGIAYRQAGETKKAKAALKRAVGSGKSFSGLEEARAVLAEMGGEG